MTGWRYADDAPTADATPQQPAARGWRYADSEPSWGQSFGYGAADGASFGWGDEGVAHIEALGSSLTGGSYSDTYHRRVAEARERLSSARGAHPDAVIAGQLTGIIGTTALPGGALRLAGAPRLAAGVEGILQGRALPGQSALARIGGQRGARATLAQMGSGAYTGAAYGAVSGAGMSNADGDIEGLAHGALAGGASGAAFGAALPLLGQTFLARDPALRAVTGATVGGVTGGVGAELMGGDWKSGAAAGAAIGAGAGYGGRALVEAGARGIRRAFPVNPRAAGSTTSMAMAPIPPAGGGGGRGPAAPAPINPTVAREADDLMYESGFQSVDDFERHLDETADRSPFQFLWADTFGNRAGTMRTRALAQGRGTTADIAERRSTERVRGLSTQLTDTLMDRLGVRSTPRRAGETAEDAYERISDDIYNPILNGVNIAAPFRNELDDIVANRMDPDLLRLATDRMGAVARMRGQAAPRPGEARYYHKLYSALGQTLRNLRQNPSAVERRLFGPEELAAAEKLRYDMATTMDRAIPRYNEARTQWAGWADAQNWVDRGRALVMGRHADDYGRVWRPEDVRAFMDDLTPFQQEHVRIGVADELAQRFTMRGKAVGLTNPAEAFNVEGLQNILREIFPDRAAGNAYLGILNQANQLMRNAQTWGGGSSSFANAARAGRGFFSQLMAGLDNFGSFERSAGSAMRFLRDDAALADDNRIGSFLLSPVGRGAPAEDAALRRQLLAELRRMEKERLDRGRNATLSGVAAIPAPDEVQWNN